MKRTTAFILAAVAVFAVIACASGCYISIGGDEDRIAKADDDTLIKEGTLAAERMRLAVHSDAYLETVGNGMLDAGMIETAKTSNVTYPKAVYEITVDPEKIIESLAEDPGKYGEIPSLLRPRVISSVYSYLVQYVNSKSGSDALAFSAMLSDGGSRLLDMPEGRRVFIYVCDEGYPVFALFYSDGGGIVSYTTQWLIADCAKITSEETLMTELGYDQIPTLTVKRIK